METSEIGVTSKQSRTYFGDGALNASEADMADMQNAQKLITALILESEHPGHQNGMKMFLKVLKNLTIDDIISGNDTFRILQLAVHQNKADILRKLWDCPNVPKSNWNHPKIPNLYKKAIRVAAYDVLDFLIEINIPIWPPSKQNFEDIKSLIFNILKCVEIGSKKKQIQNVFVANRFWNYLSNSLFQLYSEQNKQKPNAQSDANAHKNDENENKNNNQFSSILTAEMKNDDNDDLALMRAQQFMVSNPLVINSIYKYVISLSGKHFMEKLYPVLQFLCEHYCTFNDEHDLIGIHNACVDDTLFDCSSLRVASSLLSQNALEQIENNSKLKNLKIKSNKKFVRLFWCEYVMVRLVNEYLGIDIHKIKNKKSQNNVVLGNKYMNDDGYYNDLILECVSYIAANGVSEHMSDIIVPMIENYKNEFGKNGNNNNDVMGELVKAMEFGDNIWNLKKMKNKEMSSLFENICGNSIELPLHVISFILSFVVL